MMLYHGTNADIKTINLGMCRPYKDFGTGFYLASIKEQAIKMAVRISKIHGGKPIVNIYEVADDFMADERLSVKNFGTKATTKWANFVMNNRNRYYSDFANPLCNFDNKYDVVAGSIANDDLAFVFRQYQSGLISLESLLVELEYKEATNQYSFHTEKALQLLKKVGVSYE